MEIPGLASADEVEVTGVATSSGARVMASRLVSSTAWAASGRAGKRKAESRSNATADRVPVIALVELRLVRWWEKGLLSRPRSEEPPTDHSV